jgi:hypothetical protein
MNKQELLKHGFVEQTYQGQEGTYLVKKGKAEHFPYAREHMVGAEVTAYSDAVMEITPKNEIQFYVPYDDYLEGPYPLDSEEGQGLLKDAIAAKVDAIL